MQQLDNLAHTHRPLWHNFLLCCGIIGSVLFSIAVFGYGAISSDYDMMRQPIGELELLGHGWVQSVNFVVFGLFVFAFAFGLYKELQGGLGAVLLPVLQALFALGLVFSGIFIHEPFHTPSGLLAIIPLVISFFVFAARFAGDPRWPGWAAYSVTSALVIAILFALFYYANAHHGRYAGVLERGVVFTRSLWLLLFTIRLMTGSSLGPEIKTNVTDLQPHLADHQ
ncbi:MAG: DUF998 domain-containing protein [Bacteroidetes bacterium]|nr:DUF998 domain-containing protein [Bacteroidota bacterium]